MTKILPVIYSKQLIFETKNGNVILEVDDEGKLKFRGLDQHKDSSLIFDPVNNHVEANKFKFKDGTSFQSANDQHFDSSGRLKSENTPLDYNDIKTKADKGSAADDRFSNNRLKSENAPSDYDDIRTKANKGSSADDRFFGDRLKNIHTPTDYDDIKNNSLRGVDADNRFLGGRLRPEHTPSDYSDIASNALRGVSADTDLSNISVGINSSGLITLTRGGIRGNSTFQLNNGHVGLGNVDNLSSATIINNTFANATFTTVQTNAANGNSAYQKFNSSTGKLLDNFLSDNALSKLNNGDSAFNKFDGFTGKLLDANISSGILSDIGKGVLANADLGSADVQITPGGTIQFFRGGSRTTSTGTALTKTHVGLNLVDNLSSATIISNTFADTKFTAVSGNAANGALAHTDLSNISISVSNGLVTLNKGGSRGTATSTITKAHVGLDLVDNKSSSTIINDTFANATFTTVQSTANTANSTANSALSTANTANSTANTISGRFDASGRLLSANLSKITVTNPTNARTGVSLYGTGTSQIDTPALSLGESCEVDALVIKNAINTFNYINGLTYIKTLEPIDTASDIGGSSFPFRNGYIGNLTIGGSSPTLTVTGLLSAASTVVQLLKQTRIANTSGTQPNIKGTLALKANGTASLFTDPALFLENSNSTNGWGIQPDGGNDLSFCAFVNGGYTLRGYLQNTNVSGGVQINFTGQHRNIPKNNISDYVNKTGMIVVSTGEYDSITINESLPYVELSTKRNQKSAFGVVSDKEDIESTTREYKQGTFVSVFEKQNNEDDTKLIINSLGEGAIWICNINGNLENGDYITTCEIPGYGMKQDDDLLHNYTVAKITCDCDFNLQSSTYICEEFQFEGKTYRKAFVGCTYHCG